MAENARPLVPADGTLFPPSKEERMRASSPFSIELGGKSTLHLSLRSIVALFLPLRD